MTRREALPSASDRTRPERENRPSIQVLKFKGFPEWSDHFRTELLDKWDQ
jgi:hypothetical protein